MNSKQKLLTFTAIGTVFATAIATVALIGTKNLQELHAGNEREHKMVLTEVFDWDDSDPKWVSYVLYGETCVEKEDYLMDENNTYVYVTKGTILRGQPSDDYIFSVSGYDSIYEVTLSFALYMKAGYNIKAYAEVTYEDEDSNITTGTIDLEKSAYDSEYYSVYANPSVVGTTYVNSVVVEYDC